MDPELVTVSEDELAGVEAAAGVATGVVLAALTTVAIVVGAAAGGVEVVGFWMNSAAAAGVELLDGTAAGVKVSVTDEAADEAVYEGTAATDGEVVDAPGLGMSGGYSTPIVDILGQSIVT